jgi:hypothetical protein
MLRELTADPDSGLLYSRTQRYGLREITLLQYWRSADALMEFSHAAMHRRAWRDFYKVASRGTDVGLWHETYVVPPGHYESIYGSVPSSGLAVIHGLTPIGRRTDSARARLGAVGEPRTTAEPETKPQAEPQTEPKTDKAETSDPAGAPGPVNGPVDDPVNVPVNDPVNEPVTAAEPA